MPERRNAPLATTGTGGSTSRRGRNGRLVLVALAVVAGGLVGLILYLVVTTL